MTTTGLRPAPPIPTGGITGLLRGFFAPGDLISFLIVTALLLIPPLSLKAAEWPLSMQVIVPITILSVVFGLLLSRSRFGELLALIISTTYGVCLVLLLTALSLGGGLGTGVYEVFSRSVTWVIDLQTGGINPEDGDIVFTMLVANLFWFLGYSAAWHTFRLDRVWRVIVPPGLILTSNMILSTTETNLDGYFVVYLFLSLLLVVRSNLETHEWHWQVNGISVPRRLRRQFLLVGAVLALMTLSMGWIVPSGNLQERLDSFQDFLDNDPVQRMSEFWNRLFSPVDALGPTTADYYGGDKLDLGGAIRLGEQDVFMVDAPNDRRYYWRSRTFDIYSNGRWTTSADTRLIDSTSPFNVQTDVVQERELVQQEFTLALNSSRLIYTAPQPLQVDLETRVDLSYTAPEADPARSMNISVIRPQKVLRRGDSYAATSTMSTASAPQLREASTNYPIWVTGPYLQVASSITPRTIELALQVAADAGATNPYDQAKAIEAYLRRNIVYNESIPRPPANQDPVDWVLFDFKEGYCNYYASAMIVMLRGLGIPARMAAGFSQGQFDPGSGRYEVTERDAHTWVEAYFPGYGWIEFEPTASQQPIDRVGDEQVAPPQVALQSNPTPTPTATLAPTSTPAPTNTPDENEENESNIPTPSPTITPTPSPTPTATPVIVPTQPPPVRPESPNPIELILPALGLLLAGILLFALLVLIGTLIYWWWEWRGMGGMSPISRAYARLERYIGLLGFRPRADQTTEERRGAMIRQVPQAERPITAISRMYTTERYGRGNQHPAEVQRRSELAERAWPEVRRNILQRWLRRFQFWRRD